jgi:hypothetical protein
VLIAVREVGAWFGLGVLVGGCLAFEALTVVGGIDSGGWENFFGGFL